MEMTTMKASGLERDGRAKIWKVRSTVADPHSYVPPICPTDPHSYVPWGLTVTKIDNEKGRPEERLLIVEVGLAITPDESRMALCDASLAPGDRHAASRREP
jgi:hypothetical protein